MINHKKNSQAKTSLVWSTTQVSHVEAMRKHYLLCSSPCSPDGTVRHSSMWPWRRRRTSPPIRKPANNRAGEQKNRGREMRANELKLREARQAQISARTHVRTHSRRRKAHHKQREQIQADGWREKTQTNWLTHGFTLSYFTARTDGSHTPQRLLEGCIYMEAAVAIRKML